MIVSNIDSSPLPRDDARMTYKVTEEGNIKLIIVGGINLIGNVIKRINYFTFNPKNSYTEGNWSSALIEYYYPVTYQVYRCYILI
jgi:hypothetical protein